MKLPNNTKLIDNPWSIEVLMLINNGMSDKKRLWQIGERSLLIPRLNKGGYLMKLDHDTYALTARGFAAIKEKHEKKEAGVKAAAREIIKQGTLKLPRHPRQDEMDALRQIPSVFNGVRHYAKK
jgi:hypothetical protein